MQSLTHAPRAREAVSSTSADPAGLAIEGVGKTYGAARVLSAVSLTAAPGSYVVLLGPSGSGKTTLLSILGGFARPDEGRVRLDGEDVTDAPPAARPTTTVFQDYALFPHMSVAGNVGFGLRMRRTPKAEAAARVEEALALVGLGGFGERRIDQMSGGQRQRVALARALVVKPKMLLLDEPLGALDMHLRWRMQDELWRLQRKTGAIFVHVTHDQDEAMNLGDVVCVLNHGRIEDAGPPRRVYLEPATAFVAGFMGESNRLEGRVLGVEAGLTIVETPIGRLASRRGAAPGPALVMLRPEHLRLVEPDAPGALALTLGGRAFQGAHERLWARAPGAPEVEILIKHAGAPVAAAEGDRVHVAVDPAHVGLFAPEPAPEASA